MRVEGRCHCGRIRYAAVVDPAHVRLCHCTDCQRLSGSAYRVSVPVRSEDLELHGEPRVYVKTADSGKRRAHAFCPECGSPVYSADPEGPRGFSLRVPCLDQRDELPPRVQIWCDSAIDWVRDLGGAPEKGRQ